MQPVVCVMELIKGREVVAALNKRLTEEVEQLTAAGKRPPKLAILRVGEQPDQISYERGAGKRMFIRRILTGNAFTRSLTVLTPIRKLTVYYCFVRFLHI